MKLDGWPRRQLPLRAIRKPKPCLTVDTPLIRDLLGDIPAVERRTRCECPACQPSTESPTSPEGSR